jgi:hypothetical protein
LKSSLQLAGRSYYLNSGFIKQKLPTALTQDNQTCGIMKVTEGIDSGTIAHELESLTAWYCENINEG